MDINLTFSQISDAANEAYQYARQQKGGANANYIPYLANIDSGLFGLSVMLPDGRSVNVGDTGYRFGIESVSKVPTAILCMRQTSSLIFAILLENDHPSTPLVNAGAISACSMVQPAGDADAKWKAITDNITDLCGSAPVLIDELYKSESDTNFNNRAITWLLKNYGRIYDDPAMSLDLYTRQCSLGITTEQLSVMAATIAAGGVNPLTGKRVFDSGIAPKITTLIATVGFYQHSGDWLYTSGIPAKSGVGGGVLGVLPGVLGIAAFAPPLDAAGNSVKAQAAILRFMEILGLGIMNGDRVTVAADK